MKKFLILLVLLLNFIPQIFGKEVPVIQIGLPQADVIKAIGKPTVITKDYEQSEVWIYDEPKKFPLIDGANFGNINNDTKHTTFLIKFDSDKNIKSFSYHKSLI